MKLFKILLFVLVFALGCQESSTTEIPMNTMGFSFRIPSQWEKSDDIFAVPIFNEKSLDFSFYFLTDQAKKEKNTLEANNNINTQTVSAICNKSYKLFKISVFNKDSFDGKIESSIGWETSSEAGENEKFLFYFAAGEKPTNIEGKYSEKYEMYLSQSRKVKKTLKTFAPQEPKQATSSSQGLTGKLEFSASDLDGNSHSSQSLFARNKYTMINIWGTYCGPCLNEMPELARMDKETKGLGVIGIVIDADGNKETAKQILHKSKAEFVNLVPNPEIEKKILASVSAIPTSFFVNQEGEIVSPVIVGADLKAYQQNIEKLLKQ